MKYELRAFLPLIITHQLQIYNHLFYRKCIFAPGRGIFIVVMIGGGSVKKQSRVLGGR